MALSRSGQWSVGVSTSMSQTRASTDDIPDHAYHAVLLLTQSDGSQGTKHPTESVDATTKAMHTHLGIESKQYAVPGARHERRRVGLVWYPISHQKAITK